MKSRSVAGILPALGFSAMPTLTCPACLPVLAAALGAVGLTFIAERAYLVWLNSGALLIALFLLARGEQKWVSGPVLVAAAGAAGITFGKFVWTNSAIWWIGFGLFVGASAWSSLTRKSKRLSCSECKP